MSRAVESTVAELMAGDEALARRLLQTLQQYEDVENDRRRAVKRYEAIRTTLEQAEGIVSSALRLALKRVKDDSMAQTGLYAVVIQLANVGFAVRLDEEGGE